MRLCRSWIRLVSSKFRFLEKIVFFQQVNSTANFIALTGLEENATYQVFVVARNDHGTSLPSSIVFIKLTNNTEWSKGVTSPPHSLAVASHSATWVTISWQPPEFSHPTDKISYR